MVPKKWRRRPAVSSQQPAANPYDPEDSDDPDYYQESAEVCGRTEYPFLNGMYDTTLPEPWQGWDYRHITTNDRRKYHPSKKSKKYRRYLNQLETVV